MKKTFLSLYLIVSSYHMKAQWGINAYYILSDVTTKNVGIAVRYDLTPKHQFQLGLKYHFDDDSTKLPFRHFYQNLVSSKLSNKIGLTFEYRLIFRPNKIIQPYLFYSFQFIRSQTKENIRLSVYDSIKRESIYVGDSIMTFKPINFFENHIGIGLNINLNHHLSIYAGMSGGVTYFTDIPDLDDLNAGRTNYAFLSSTKEEFSWLFNTGVSYRFNKEKDKKRKKRRW